MGQASSDREARSFSGNLENAGVTRGSAYGKTENIIRFSNGQGIGRISGQRRLLGKGRGRGELLGCKKRAECRSSGEETNTESGGNTDQDHYHDELYQRKARHDAVLERSMRHEPPGSGLVSL